MPSASRRKAKQAKKIRTLITPNHHSSPTVHFQGKSDLISLKEENGSLRPISERNLYVVVEEEKSKEKGYSLSTGAAASANHNKMEGSFNGTLEETQKVESLSEDKEVVIEDIKSSFDFGGEVAADGKSRSLSETQDGDSIITDTDEQATQSEEIRELVHSGKVEEIEDVSESVVDYFQHIVSSANEFSDARKAPVDNLLALDTVELELKEEQEKDFLSPEEADGISPVVANHRVKGLEETEFPPSEDNNDLSSVSGNEGLRETEVVETIKDLTGANEIKLPSSEEKNVLSSVVTDGLTRESEESNKIYSCSSLPPTDVASKETSETTIPISDESDEVPPTITEAVLKGIEKSWLPSTDEKVGEPSDFQEPSKESANESFQLSANVPAAETTSATVQDKTEIPRSIENQSIVSVTQRQYTSWKSCCGLFEILRRDDR